jgi:hypothetical protein
VATSGEARTKIEREASGITGADPRPPTQEPVERSAGRPSTPEGVGRAAPLTACRRGAKSSAGSAGEEGWRRVAHTVPGVDSGVDESVDSVSTPVLALGQGWGRFRAADHTTSRWINASIRDLVWSAARKRVVSGFGDGDGHGVFGRFRSGVGDRGRCEVGKGRGISAGREGTVAGGAASAWCGGEAGKGRADIEIRIGTDLGTASSRWCVGEVCESRGWRR